MQSGSDASYIWINSKKWNEKLAIARAQALPEHQRGGWVDLRAPEQTGESLLYWHGEVGSQVTL